MITDNQVKKLKKYLSQGKTLEISAARSGMDEKTARKYRDQDKLPSEIKAGRVRDWCTRGDPFKEAWDIVKPFLKINDGIEAKTLFQYLQREDPGCFSDGQLRTFQRRVKNWRALEGPAREVYFPQKHQPGRLSQSDFTHMSNLGVTLGGIPFEHMVYHFVLTYSNWETCNICFSESFESLSEGLQHSLWDLGGVPEQHQTDRLTAAVNKPDNPEKFTRSYQGVLDHYKIEGRRTNPASPNENGDVEQSHYRFKKAVDQALMLRGSRDFSCRKEYEVFLKNLLKQLNQGRLARFEEELSLLRSLPARRLDSCSRFDVRVGPSSTIRVKHNVYSVHSRLIKERVTVRLYSDYLEIWYGQRCVENYRYRSDLFPTSRFRIAYDSLCKCHSPAEASKEYLRILQLAAHENEIGVDDCLRCLMDNEELVSADNVEQRLHSGKEPEVATDVAIDGICLSITTTSFLSGWRCQHEPDKQYD